MMPRAGSGSCAVISGAPYDDDSPPIFVDDAYSFRLVVVCSGWFDGSIRLDEMSAGGQGNKGIENNE